MSPTGYVVVFKRDGQVVSIEGCNGSISSGPSYAAMDKEAAEEYRQHRLADPRWKEFTAELKPIEAFYIKGRESKG